MGFIFSKHKQDKNKKELQVTEQDKAVLLLKQQRDKIKQYQKKIYESLEKQRQVAKQLLQDGKKEKARLLLRKKRFMEQMLDKTDGQLLNLETMVHDIEFAQIQIQVTNGLKVGNDALKQIHELMSIDDLEKLMDETREGIERQQEMDELLSGSLTSEDEQAVMDELDSILAEELPQVPEIEAVETPEEELPEFPEVPKDLPKPTEAKKSRQMEVAT